MHHCPPPATGRVAEAAAFAYGSGRCLRVSTASINGFSLNAGFARFLAAVNTRYAEHASRPANMLLNSRYVRG